MLVRYTYKSKSTDFSACQVDVLKLDLIKRAEKVELSSTYFKPNAKDRIKYTQQIQTLQNNILDAVNSLKAQKVEPRGDLVKQEMERLEQESTEEYLNDGGEDFLEVFDKCLLSKASQGEIGKYTKRQYGSTRTLLENFIDNRLETINADDWTLDLYDEFVYYLTEVHEGITENSTVGKHIKHIKAVLSWAESRGYAVDPAYRSKSFKVSKSKKKVFHLEEAEVDAFFNHDFSKNKRLERTRDVFVLNCFIGLRVSDLVRLRKGHVFEVEVDGQKAECVRIETKKGGRGDNAFVPLLPRPKEILRKYNFNLPKISDQKYNEYIKDALREAEINRQVEVKPGEFKPLHEIVTSHIAVKTFITMCMKKGLPIKMVATITNKSVKTINEHYYSVDEDEIVRRMLF